LDSIRDLIDLNKKSLQQTEEERKAFAVVKSFLPPGKAHHQFTSVSDAAKRAGIKKMFEVNNKTLSKFVHPTAMTVCAPIPAVGADKIVERFVSLGRELGKESIKLIDKSHMKLVYKKFQSSIEALGTENLGVDFSLVK